MLLVGLWIGPSHVFWLFAFERYNGFIEQQPNNDRSIEVQLMQRFIDNHKPAELPATHHIRNFQSWPVHIIYTSPEERPARIRYFANIMQL